MKLRLKLFSTRSSDRRSITGSLLTPAPRLQKTNMSGDLVTVLVASAGVAMVLSAVPAKGLNAYITNSGGNTASVVDTKTNKVTKTISVGDGPGGVAVNPKGTTVYVVNTGNGTVSVIDTKTNKVTKTISTGKPCDLIFDRLRSRPKSLKAACQNQTTSRFVHAVSHPCKRATSSMLTFGTRPKTEES
jgi:YVTN family beta-propeller protein